MGKAGDDPVPLGEIAPLWSCGQGEFSDNCSPLANLGGQLPVFRGIKNIQPGSKDSNGSAAVPDCFLVGNSVDAPGQSADNGQSRQVQITRNGLGDGLAVGCVAPGTNNGDCIFPGLQRLPGTIQQNGRVINYFFSKSG